MFEEGEGRDRAVRRDEQTIGLHRHGPEQTGGEDGEPARHHDSWERVDEGTETGSGPEWIGRCGSAAGAITGRRKRERLYRGLCRGASPPAAPVTKRVS